MILDPDRHGSTTWPAPERETVVETMADAVSGGLSMVALFGPTTFDVFQLSEAFGEQFEDEYALRAYVDRMAGEVRSEYFEHDLLSGLSPSGAGVDYRSVEDGDRRLVQVIYDGRGMLVVVDAEEPVRPVVGAAAAILGRLF